MIFYYFNMLLSTQCNIPPHGGPNTLTANQCVPLNGIGISQTPQGMTNCLSPINGIVPNNCIPPPCVPGQRNCISGMHNIGNMFMKNLNVSPTATNALLLLHPELTATFRNIVNPENALNKMGVGPQGLGDLPDPSRLIRAMNEAVALFLNVKDYAQNVAEEVVAYLKMSNSLLNEVEDLLKNKLKAYLHIRESFIREQSEQVRTILKNKYHELGQQLKELSDKATQLYKWQQSIKEQISTSL